MGNGTVKTVKINRQLGYEVVTPHALVCYNFAEGITDEEEEILMASDPTLYTVGTIDWNFLATESTADQTRTDPTTAATTTAQQGIQHTPGTMSVDETPIQDKLRFMDIAH
jgi:hypothetical protein